MISLNILFLLIEICSLHLGVAFTPSLRSRFIVETSVYPVQCRSQTCVRAVEDSNREEEDESFEESSDRDLSWIQEAMGTIPGDNSPTPSSSFPLKSGIAGFAVDSDQGFVCILSPETDDELDGPDSYTNRNRGERFTHVFISPTDKERLCSAEALCLVQLAGGLDLGAAVFPPETLARVVASELINDEEDINVEDLRSRVTLLGVTALKNEKYSPEDRKENGRQTATDSDDGSIESSPERDTKIKDGSPKMLPAIRNLPGLTEVTTEHIIGAMQIHADVDGKLDRQAFSELLGTLRGDLSSRIDDQKVKFRITASISDNSSSSSPSKLVDVDHVVPFQAVALAMRYKKSVTVSEELFDDKYVESVNVLSKYPAFKPVQELMEDAQVMNGFISSMFFKETAPDNDDKAY